jgi:hypothetical protein
MGMDTKMIPIQVLQKHGPVTLSEAIHRLAVGTITPFIYWRAFYMCESD